MRAYTYRLSLSARHDSADLSSLPSLLGLTARRLWKAGDERIAPNGRVIGGIWRYSACSMDLSEQSGQSLPERLAVVVEQLKPHKAVFEEWAASGAAFRVFIGWFFDSNSGDCFGWELLRDISDLKIDLDFDVYGPDSNPPVDAP